MNLKQHLKFMALASVLFLLTSCFVVHTETHYDEDCDLHSKQYELVFNDDEPYWVFENLEHSMRCDDSECVVAHVAAAAALPVTSFIVSGSVVVVGNSINWLEKQGKCDDSVTQRAVDRFVEHSVALGGKVVGSTAELIEWIRGRNDEPKENVCVTACTEPPIEGEL